MLYYIAMKTLAITCADCRSLHELQEHGADEVIFSLKNSTFSALKEMEEKEVLKCCEKAHELGLKVSVLMNRLFPQNEVMDAATKMTALLNYGADYIIFADPGLLYYARKEGMENRLIYQPETLITSSCDAQFWMDQNLHSVVVSSLITKQEITDIGNKVKGLSIYIHGRLLMSVSKRKLLKAYHDETSVPFQYDHNKNLYLVEEKRNGHMPIYENENACMIFTDYIQESFLEMPEFMQSLDRFVIDTSWLSQDEGMDALQIYADMLKGKKGDTQAYLQKYGKENFSDGYYGSKTIK